MSSGGCAGKAALLAMIMGLSLWGSRGLAQNVLWSENFDSLVLGPNVNESIVDPTAFTHDPPTGWSLTNGPELAGATGGVEEWRGWSFADNGFWAQVDPQRREEFTRGLNVIAVADSDEFDDIDQVPDNVPYATFLTTPAINLTNSNSSTLALQFDSSWRPEAAQTATVTATFSGGAEVEIIRFESNPVSPNFKDDNSTNDSLTAFFDKPEGATSVEFEFGYFNSQNNWWWAIDNLQLLDGDPLLRAVIDRDSGEITLFNRTGEAQDIKGYSIESAAGALDPSEWNSIAGNFDSAGDGSIDESAWVRLTSPGTNTDLSEGALETGTLAANTSLDLGASWLRYYEDEEDLRFRYIDGSGAVLDGIVEVTGNGGASYAFGDLDFDNDIDGQDWQAFVAGVGTDVSGASQAVRYQSSDLNNDGRHSPADFILFRNAYNAANGANAFASIGAAVPEPSAVMLLVLAAAVAIAASLPKKASRMLQRSSLALLAFVLAAGAASTAHAQALISIFSENFDSLPLGPNVEEASAGEEVWTDVPPEGWIVDRTGVPGWNNPPDNNGKQEWIGWNFADRLWWPTVDDQRRSEFTRASGTIMVADPDEWDDEAHPPSAENGWYNTSITTRPIAIDGLPADSISLSFDSSWRPEFDADFHQSAAIDVSFDGGAPVEILRWLSDPSSPNFKDDNSTNDFISIPVGNPAGANSMEITFRMFDAGNDWWWAVDNIDVSFEAEPLTLEINTTTGEARILASVTPGANFNISSYSITSENGSLNPGGGGGGGPVDGDYNNNGQVEQADLDLVLLNWGEATPPAPVGWTNDLPEGQVDQAELDGVLLAWGNTGGGGGGEGWLAGNLSAQGVDSIGTGLGESWEVLTASESQLFEAFLLGGTLFDADLELPIGEAFQVGGMEDLQFSFSTVGGNEIQGNVVYVSGALAGSPVPEPASVVALCLCGLAASVVVLYRRRGVRMHAKPLGLGLVVAAVLLAALTQQVRADGLLIRHYPFEGNANDTVTFDFEDENLFGSGVTYPGLTDGRTGMGASFSGMNSFLEGPALNDPVDSPTGTTSSVNLNGISDRGFQFWAFPRADGMGARQDVVMDTNQHGVYISPANTWGLVYGGQDHDTGVPVTFGDWTHVHLASFNSTSVATLYLDGEAIAAVPGRYNPGLNISPIDGWTLEVGANAGVLGTLDPFPGSENFYDGIVDDLKFSVYGTNAELDSPFNFGVDNDAAAALLAGFSPGDVNLDGQVSGDGTGPAASDDVTAFVDGWMFRNELDGQLVGDVTTRSSGDLNFDGITDIADWAVLNLANPGAGAAALSAISGGAGVPEPSTLVLAGVGVFGLLLAMRRRKVMRTLTVVG